MRVPLETRYYWSKREGIHRIGPRGGRNGYRYTTELRGARKQPAFGTAYHRNTLAALDAVVNWENFQPTLKKALRKREPKGPGGRPAFDAVVKFNMLVLQSLYNVSDAELEFQVEDRATFRAFVGLSSGDTVPDEKTIWEFRDTLVQAKVMKKLFHRFESVLSGQDLYVNDGRIVDAEIGEAPRRRVKPESEEHTGKQTQEDSKERRRRENRKRQVDTDARYTTKHNTISFGYKNTVKIDRGSKLIMGYATCPANRHDATVFDDGYQNGGSGEISNHAQGVSRETDNRRTESRKQAMGKSPRPRGARVCAQEVRDASTADTKYRNGSG